MADGADRDDPRAIRRRERGVQADGEGEVAQVVDAELPLPALGVRVSRGVAITPALFTRMCSGPCQAATNAAMVDRSARSSRPTVNCPDPEGSSFSRRSATRAPASVSRTARVTSAPAAASARAVSTPIPELAPVTTARRPCRSTPSITSVAVVSALNIWHPNKVD